MTPGDILYNNVSTNALCVMVKRMSDGFRYDFTAKAWAAVPVPPAPFPAAMVLNMTPDPVFHAEQTVVVPGVVAQEATAILVEAIQAPAGSPPASTQTYWVGRGPGVPIALARGATISFTG